MFTLAICTILNGFTQVNINILLIQSYHTTCVSFSCEFNIADKIPNAYEFSPTILSSQIICLNCYILSSKAI